MVASGAAAPARGAPTRRGRRRTWRERTYRYCLFCCAQLRALLVSDKLGEAPSRSTGGLGKNNVREERYRAGPVKPTSWGEIARMAGLGLLAPPFFFIFSAALQMLVQGGGRASCSSLRSRWTTGPCTRARGGYRDQRGGGRRSLYDEFGPGFQHRASRGASEGEEGISIGDPESQAQPATSPAAS